MYSSTPQSLRGAHPAAVPAATPRYQSELDSSASRLLAEGLENAGRLVDRHLKEDASFVELSGQLRIATHSKGDRAIDLTRSHTGRSMWPGCALFRTCLPFLSAQTNISGNADIDYPSLATSLPALSSMSSIVQIRHTPLPPELVQEFQSILTNKLVTMT